MAIVQAPVQILCRQCSAPLPVEVGSQFVDCEYCGTTNVVEKGRTVLHYAVRPTLRENDGEAALRRWMGGNETIKGLDAKAQVERPVFQHFPMWLIRLSHDEDEEVVLQPAAALSISELKQLPIPAWDLEPYDHVYDDAAIEATVPYNAMLQWLKDERQVREAQIRAVSLVHLPIYQFHYIYNKRRYSAIVDAASGAVFANIYPSKWETPYRTIALAAFIAYFLAALIPLISYINGGFGGLGAGIGIYLIVALVLAVPIFVLAATISAKV